MPQPFHLLTVEEFAALLDQYPFSRRINAVHMHHTWRPNHAQDRGHDSVVAMWRFHTQTLGWSDIAQHVTIDSEGRIWTGRDWNSPPASASGHNGNRSAGPFMFEMIGDFDVGKDPFEGAQRETTLRVIAHVQRRFGLPPEALRFHNEMSPKSCPGSGIDKAEVVTAVRRLHAELAAPAATSQPIEPIEPFGPEMLVTHDVLNDLVAMQNALATPRTGTDGDAELPEQRMSREQVYLLFGGESDGETRGGTAGRGRLTAEMLAELRPHLVNLTEGRFSGGGRYQSDRGDVDALFGEHLPEALKRARKLGEPLHLVLYAHGGLVSEGAALETAYTHVTWWKQHPNVYPVYFVWETGLFETIGQALGGRGRAIAPTAPRAFTDGIVEAAVRYSRLAPWAWSRMKLSAQAASAEHGGARYVADKLADFAGRYHKAFGEREVRLHGIGHSAGSIFHAHFLPAALEAGTPAFETLHLLAPAIRVDEFLDRLAPRLGDGIDRLAMFTMRKELERDDTCKGVYRKSLLYLIYHALEREKETPILGLEESLRADADAAELFGLGGAASDVAEVVFSKTDTISGRSATTATTHGGFDNDAPTMQSVLRRILDAEPGEQVAPFPAEAQRGFDPWAPSEPMPPELAAYFAQGGGVTAVPVRPPEPIPPAPSAPSLVMPATVPRGQRRALCIGIDRYPTQPLAGCVHDAQTWAALLRDLGFETETLLDEAATRDGILDRLRDLVGSGHPGDVLVFQYAGHGTYFDDESRDEDDARDEAFCPIDLDTGAVVLDDEVREVFAQLRDGVNLTCFIDCCHSGSITRLAPRPGLDERPRMITPTPAMRAFHQRLRTERGRSRTAATPAAMRDVTFAACQPFEVAWESNGQGDFTVRGTAVLRERGLGLTNQMFCDAVLDRFGPSPRQTPYFDAVDAAKSRSLLAPLVGPSGGSGGSGGTQPSADGPDGSRALVQGLHRAVQQFEQALSKLS